MEKIIPSNWMVNALLLLFIAAVSYMVFLALMVGSSPDHPERHQPPLAPTASTVQT